MIAIYGIGILITLVLALILIYKIGTIGFVVLLLGGLFILSSKK